jgi:hypothetical protein
MAAIRSITMPTTTQIIQQMQLELTYAANLTRQATAQKLLDYYNGEQLEHLEDVLAEQFADPDALMLQLAIDNITRFIADEISRVFDSPPMLSCENAAGQALLDDLMKTGTLPLIFKTAEVYANLNNVCALHPWWDEKSGTIKTTILPSSTLFVAQRRDDPTEAEAVIYTREIRDTITPESRVEYVHWDSEHVFIFDNVTTGAMRPPSDDNPEMINPYGILPFAWFRDQIAVGAFFSKCDESLINAQETLNVLLTSLNQLTKYQGFSQPVLSGCDAKTPIMVDPSRPIRIPPGLRDEQPGKFTFETPDSKIGDILAEVTQHVERTCSRYGISMQSLKSGAETTSGYALKIQESRLERRRVDSTPLCRSGLYQWWEVVKVINNTHTNSKIPADAELIIDFAEPEYNENPKDQLDADIKKVDNGFVSPVAIIMRDNPDLDERQAAALYNKNLADRQATKRRYGLADILNPVGGNND